MYDEIAKARAETLHNRALLWFIIGQVTEGTFMAIVSYVLVISYLLVALYVRGGGEA